MSATRDGIWNTDNAPPEDVLAMLRFCAASWQPEVRLLGNIRASDIVRACDEAVRVMRSNDGQTEDRK